MNFGMNIEEQYVKIVTINNIIKKMSKIFSFIFIGTSFVPAIALLINGDNAFIVNLIVSVLSIFLSYVIGKYIAGKMFGWAWISFCEKFNPKALVRSMGKAADNSAVEGYISGGSNGAKAAVSGVVIVFVFLIWIYLLKGTFYMIKYWNLPKEELKLKKQLEAKYGKAL